jgi:diguanylate cyclase (GGDEF)-like protein
MAAVLSLGGMFGLDQTEDTGIQEEILEQQKSVLYISSYSYSYLVVEQQLDGIKKRFEGQPVAVDVEFMDTKRFTEDENYDSFQERINYKLEQGLSYDAIIVGDDNGLQFLMEKKEDLFPDIPLFFMGINSFDRALEASQDPNITGVLEKKTFKETIRLAQMLNEDLESIVMVIDSSPSSDAEYVDMMLHEEDFPELEFITVHMEDMNPDEFFEYITRFDINDMYLNLTALTFKNGEVWSYEDMTKKQVEVLNTPVYAYMTAGLENGMLGGHVLSHVDQGFAAADMAMRYFHGTPMEEILFIPESPNVNMVDYNQLIRFGFDEESLPEDTIILNHEPTFLEMYGNYILLAFAIFTIETVIIIALITNIRSRRKTAKKLIESNKQVNEMNAQLVDTVDVLNSTNRELEDRIAEVSERDSKIREMIYVDELTGLLTRYAIGEKIRQITMDTSKNAAIMLLDVDNFKNINDAFGHSFGDEVLRIIGERLGEIVNQQISVSRFGGDEFVIVVKDYKDEECIRSLVERVKTAFTKVMYHGNTHFVLTTSIGVTKFPEHGTSYEELLKRADVALHYSKDSGKDTATIYEMTMDVNFQDKVHFQNLLRNAFDAKEFYMNFQPIIYVKEKRIYGFEALIRWKSKELGQVSPFRLITEAEEMGLIVKLGEWIIEESLAFAEMINKKAEKPITVSINVSTIQLMYSEFSRKLIESFENYDLKAENIILEMTETTLISDIDAGKNTINQLRDYGFKISLDDFGTGYSSLSYLKNFALDVLKVDKSFIDQIIDSSYDRYLVEAILKIAKERNIETVAEGVETLEQFNTLMELECDSIQGYLFSKPLSLEDAKAIKDEDVLNKIK